MGTIKVNLKVNLKNKEHGVYSQMKLIEQLANKHNLTLIGNETDGQIGQIYSGEPDALLAFTEECPTYISIERNDLKPDRSDIDELDYLIVFTRNLLFEEQKRSGTVSRKDKAGAQARVSLMSHLCETLAKRREELLTNRRNSNDVRFSRRDA